MKLLDGGPSGRLGGFAFIAILAAFSLAPRPASAGCNSHARPGGSSSWRTGPIDALLRGDPPAGLANRDEPTPAPPTCSGPSCSNSVPAPLSSVVDRDLGKYRGDGLLSLAPRLPSSASRVFRDTGEPLTPAFPTSRIFHPPRPIV